VSELHNRNATSTLGEEEKSGQAIRESKREGGARRFAELGLVEIASWMQQGR
jgi:hypothetical protein